MRSIAASRRSDSPARPPGSTWCRGPPSLPSSLPDRRPRAGQGREGSFVLDEGSGRSGSSARAMTSCLEKLCGVLPARHPRPAGVQLGSTISPDRAYTRAMRNSRWPRLFITAAAASMVGGAVLLVNQLTPISPWVCIWFGVAMLAIGVALDWTNLTRPWAGVPGRAIGPARERAHPGSAAAASTDHLEIEVSRGSGHCAGSTDGHHRWSRDPEVCMLCGEQLPKDRA